MEASREAVAKLTARKGHVTDVEEVILPAVIAETVRPSQHEIVTEARVRDVNQHHYHTTVQPLSYSETLPTKHFYQTLPVQEREFFHDDVDIYHNDKEETKHRDAAVVAQPSTSLVSNPQQIQSTSTSGSRRSAAPNSRQTIEHTTTTSPTMTTTTTTTIRR